MPFDPGVLQDTIRRARSCGALQPVATSLQVITDRGVDFQVRVMLDRAQPASGTPSVANPFRPYDPDLFVADASGTHVVLLNKYPVTGTHLLVVTRAFAEQESYLDGSDFDALLACRSRIGGLGFYNSGRTAGASQRHKHLQVVSTPSLPIAHWLATRTLPYRHASAALRGDPVGLYRGLLADLALDAGPTPAPYNLLVTDHCMLVVPRSQESFASISINALGFAGYFLVGSTEHLARLREAGPVAALRSVAGRA